MKVIRWNKKKNTKLGYQHPAGFMVRVTPEEAIIIIESLSSQINHNNPDRGRREFTTDEGEYFSIAITDNYLPWKK